MPTFAEMKNRYQNTTVGRQLKEMSDMVMQETFDNDITTRQCYLFDYYHDDQKEILGGTDYHPELNKDAIPVKLKFIIKEYKSASKDDPEAHIMFQPDDWNSNRLVPNWFEIGYGKWGIHFPVGLFCAIPDDRNIYHKYLIFYDEQANQFPKFGVMRCNYLFQWITDDGVNRFKRFMCGVERTQNSYTSGVWTGDKFTVFDEQGKFWLPWNSISAELKHDQRLVISMPQPEPLTFKVSKIQNTSPKGIIFVTLKQTEFNQHTDYVDLNTGEMYSDYYKSSIEPDDTTSLSPDDPSSEEMVGRLVLTTSSYKVGLGVKKKVVAAMMQGEDEIKYDENDRFTWSVKLDGFEYTEDEQEFKDLFKSFVTSGNHNEILLFTVVDDDMYVDSKLVLVCSYHTPDAEQKPIENSLELEIEY